MAVMPNANMASFMHIFLRETVRRSGCSSRLSAMPVLASTMLLPR